MLFLDLQTRSGSFTIVELTLLEFQVWFHILDLLLSRKLVRPCHGALHVLQKLSDDFLILIYVLLMINLLFFKLLGEFIDFLLLLIKDFVLLFFLSLVCATTSEISVDFLDVLIVGIDHTFSINVLFVERFKFDVVLFNAVLQSIARLWEWKVHLIGLELEVLLLFEQTCSLFLEMLSSLLEGVCAQPVFSLNESSGDLLKLLSRGVDVTLKDWIFIFQFLILISLLGIKVV